MMYQVVYKEMSNSNGMLFRRPGQRPIIILNNRHKGNLDFTLGALVMLMETDKGLTQRQKLQRRVIYLETIDDPSSTHPSFGVPLEDNNSKPADFSRN